MRLLLETTAPLERRIGWFSIALGITPLIGQVDGRLPLLAQLFPGEGAHIAAAVMLLMLGAGLNGVSVLPNYRLRAAFLALAVFVWAFVAIGAITHNLVGVTFCFAMVVVLDATWLLARVLLRHHEQVVHPPVNGSLQ